MPMAGWSQPQSHSLVLSGQSNGGLGTFVPVLCNLLWSGVLKPQVDNSLAFHSRWTHSGRPPRYMLYSCVHLATSIYIYKRE